MTEETQEANSLLALDIGRINTRAVLFDTVENRFRFLAAGKAASTINAPLSDVSEGMHNSLDDLRRVSGRSMKSTDDDLLIPSTDSGHGADHMVVTYSGGAPLKTVLVGLLDKVSIQSAKNLVNSTYTEIVETISLNDHRSAESQIDTIIKAEPDVVLVAGGTDNGASKSMLNLINTLGLALYLLPETTRPDVLYAGNPALTREIDNFMDSVARIHFTSNIRPGIATEQLGPAQSILIDIYRQIHTRKTLGIEELNIISGGFLLPTAHAIGRVVRFFSKIIPNPTSRGVLSIDLGASATVVAAAFNGDLRLRVFSNLGMGEGLGRILQNSKIEDITRWLIFDISNQQVIDYIQNKIVHPASLPATSHDMNIEQALAREVMAYAIKEAEINFPKDANRADSDSLAAFDPIVIGGGVLANAPNIAHSLIMALDGLQPVGLQQIVLDKNNLVAGLGAAAPINPTLVTQLLLDPVALLNLGYVIAPINKAKLGTKILRVRIEYDTGHSNTINVRKGELLKIPLPLGRRAKLFIDPLNRANLGLGPGKAIRGRQVIGGPFGVVVDARGRPIHLPQDAKLRRAQLKRWMAALVK